MLGMADNHMWNMRGICVAYREFFIMPNTFVNLVNHLDIKDEDKREATLTVDPYSYKVSSK